MIVQRENDYRQAGSVRFGSGSVVRRCRLNVRIAPAGGPRRVIAVGLGSARSRRFRYDFFFASGFATSRECSMKSRTVGLSVRFFRVTGPDTEPAKFKTRQQALNWCAAHYP